MTHSSWARHKNSLPKQFHILYSIISTIKFKPIAKGVEGELKTCRSRNVATGFKGWVRSSTTCWVGIVGLTRALTLMRLVGSLTGSKPGRFVVE